MKTPNKKDILSVYQDAFELGNNDVMKALESLYGQDMFQTNITERIRIFADAYNMLGIRNPLVMSYIEWASPFQDNNLVTGYERPIRAFLQLRIITSALNGNWIPKFTKDELRYSPNFRLFTKEDMIDNEFEKTHNILSVKCKDYAYFSCTDETFNGTSVINSGFYFKSKELAEYCGNQFIELWADLFSIQH